MINQNALILYAVIPQVDRSISENPFASVAWEDFDQLYKAMFIDTLKNVSQLTETDIIVYRKPDQMSEDLFIPFRNRIRLYELNDNPLIEQIESALIDLFQDKYQKVVLLLNNNPLISRSLIKRTFNQLGYEDDCIIVGPTYDEKCYLIGMKMFHESIFKSNEPDLLKKSNSILRKICQTSAMLFPLEPQHSWDRAENLLHLRKTIENLNKSDFEFPTKTYEVFKLLDKKYKLKKYLA